MEYQEWNQRRERVRNRIVSVEGDLTAAKGRYNALMLAGGDLDKEKFVALENILQVQDICIRALGEYNELLMEVIRQVGGTGHP